MGHIQELAGAICELKRMFEMILDTMKKELTEQEIRESHFGSITNKHGRTTFRGASITFVDKDTYDNPFELMLNKKDLIGLYKFMVRCVNEGQHGIGRISYNASW